MTDIQQLFSSFLRQSTALIESMPGYNHFAIEQLVTYITQPSIFSFDLLKEKGKGILYGKDIVLLRQSLINQLPVLIRHHVIGQKLQYYGLIAAIETALNQTGLEKGAGYFGDIEDIGMAHSVYKLTVGDTSYVLKPKDTNNVNCFLELANIVALETFPTYFLITKYGQWELSTYIESVTLSDYLHHNQPSDRLVQQLGYHAAFGDLIGRGDRHFENYIVSGDQLYAVDLSILFWENNEEWVFKYAKAGMTEMSIMACFINDESVFYTQLDLFYRSYVEMVTRCRAKQPQLEHVIETYFPEPVVYDIRQQFLHHRLTQGQFIDTQMKMYLKALSLFLNRLYYKQLLQKIGENYPVKLTQDPLLKMYYLANKERWSCFFLLDEYYRGYLLSRIEDSVLDSKLDPETIVSFDRSRVSALIAQSLKHLSLTE